MHSDLKVSAAAVDDESSQDNEKHNCGGDRPPVIFAPPWVGPPTIVARATSAFKVFVYHIPARLVTDRLIVLAGNLLNEIGRGDRAWARIQSCGRWKAAEAEGRPGAECSLNHVIVPLVAYC